MKHAEFKPGAVLRHFKRDYMSVSQLAETPMKYMYLFIGYAKHTETGQRLAIYKALYPVDNGEPSGLFVRPADMFESEVDRTKYPDACQRFRFEEVL